MHRNQLTPKDERLAYNIKEAARLCGVSKPTMARLLKLDKIKHQRAGRRVLIGREALIEYLSGANGGSK